jgi:hypothetical protein
VVAGKSMPDQGPAKAFGHHHSRPPITPARHHADRVIRMLSIMRSARPPTRSSPGPIDQRCA